MAADSSNSGSMIELPSQTFLVLSKERKLQVYHPARNAYISGRYRSAPERIYCQPS